MRMLPVAGRAADLLLDGYVDALNRGWSPDNIRLEAAAREQQIIQARVST